MVPNEMASSWRLGAVGVLGVATGLTLVACAGVTLGGPSQRPPVFLRPGVRQTCKSDNDCSSMNRCVKDSMQLEGICAEPVNELGAPVFLAKDATTGPGKGTCSSDADCPERSTCEKSALAQRGNCMR